jgi:hypothetical protein
MPRDCSLRHRLRPLARPVVLLVAFTAVSCWKKDPVLQVSHDQIDFGSDLASVSFSVRNAGEDVALTAGVTTLEYSIKADSAWVGVDPRSGRCEADQKNWHVVTIDRSRLVIGSNIATLRISSNAGSKTLLVRAFRAAPPCTLEPTEPWNPSPGDRVSGVSISADLIWNDGASQCPGFTATYDVYFGTTSPPPFHHDNGSVKTWDPGPLSHATTYYWRVIARDANGSTPGAFWSFTTRAAVRQP